MSYFRFGKDSDIYIFKNATNNKYQCCSCSMNNDDSIYFDYKKDMIAHVEKHKNIGDKVPEKGLNHLISGKCD